MRRENVRKRSMAPYELQKATQMEKNGGEEAGREETAQMPDVKMNATMQTENELSSPQSAHIPHRIASHAPSRVRHPVLVANRHPVFMAHQSLLYPTLHHQSSSSSPSRPS